MQERRKNKYIILDPMNHRGGGAFFTFIMENYMAHLLETSILNLSTTHIKMAKVLKEAVRAISEEQ